MSDSVPASIDTSAASIAADPDRRSPQATATGGGSPTGQPEAHSPTRARNNPGDPSPIPSDRSRRKAKAKTILSVIALVALGGVSWVGHGWWTEGRFMEGTDDAYVATDITGVLSKVSGYVAAIEVSDNQRVEAGDILARIDDGDYRLAVQGARDQIASAEATVDRIASQITAAHASVDQATATVAAMQARADEARANHDRQIRLTEGKVTSQASLDGAIADLRSAEANLKSATAAVDVARANIRVLEGQKREAQAAIAAARTKLEKAEYDLSFTVIRAPVAGIVSNRAAQVGTLLQPGSRVAAIVPLTDTRIDANFKETQLGHIRPGAHVAVKVDAYPGLVLEATVDSISPATGSVFSLLPSENATGNFTKVVQRVPVRITVPMSQKGAEALRAGMSVVVEVDTRTGAADPAATASLH